MLHTEAITLYQKNAADTLAILALDTITPAAFAGVHRHVCSAIANSAWAKCDKNTRQMLLHHGHHFTVSAAVIASNGGEQFPYQPGETPTEEQLAEARLALHARLALN